RSAEPFGINYLGTLLSSQRTDAHPSSTLAGFRPEAFRFSSVSDVFGQFVRIVSDLGAFPI
ncbi:hypothetical protein, partial [Cellulomonas sp. NPDC089187]|uniref:hypothetical protein n=1 Tax=Cellulomonas sp. NPDC089187 TaxID=3154970 RepID=UPI00341A9E4E